MLHEGHCSCFTCVERNTGLLEGIWLTEERVTFSSSILIVAATPGALPVTWQAGQVIRKSGIRNPVLIDISSGEISPLKWEGGYRWRA